MGVGCSGLQSEQNIYALLVAKNSIIVEESYFNGKSPTDLLNVQSVTKSVISLLIGIAIEQGYIPNEDVPIHTFFPDNSEWFVGEKSNITIRHLLNHTSGLDWKGYPEHTEFINSQNPVGYVLLKELENIPGEKYNYNSGANHILSVIITKTTGRTTLKFANEMLFEPLQIEKIKWEKLNDGIYDGAGFGLSLLPRDLIKLGELVLAKGNIDDVQIISEVWMDKSFDLSEKKATNWGIRNSKHGFGWYAANYNTVDVFYAMGYGGQFIFIIPSKDFVLVSNHNADTPNGIRQQINFITERWPELLEKYMD